MIRSFRHRGLKRFYERDNASQIHAAYRKKVARILADLDSARVPQDMDFPGLPRFAPASPYGRPERILERDRFRELADYLSL
jgi:plasmid maintenance system killer protein